MVRNIEKHLQIWKNSTSRRPLLIRGARQVGKSFVVEKFGKEFFDNCLTINFDLDPQYGACFEESLDPLKIIEILSALTRTDIVPGKTLLFFDEIQQCPKAIMALRYFYEKLPSLHVIGAGSLLEFTLSDEALRIPVGRVQYLFMTPLTFCEFLTAMNEPRAMAMIAELPHNTPLPEPLHLHLLSLVRLYCVLGGMPAVIQEYLNTKNINSCQHILTAIALTYRDDFGKYASKAKIPHLQKLFLSIPKLVGKKFKYSEVDDTVPSRELKTALDLLEKAGILYKVKQTSGAGLPFGADASDRNFKVIFLDVGLMQNLCGLNGDILSSTDILSVHAGAVAEQFVGQELIGNLDPYLSRELYYWAREGRTSNAEVDYLVSCDSKIFPIEVKAGSTGTLRSLQLFLAQYHISTGIKISQTSLNIAKPVTSLPLYAIEQLQELLKKVL